MSYPLGMTDVGLDPLIREEATHYVLPLVGREVDQLCIDYAVTLVVEGTDTVRLESPFTLHVDGTTHVVVTPSYFIAAEPGGGVRLS